LPRTPAPDESLKAIRQLLSIPAGGVISNERLRLDPRPDNGMCNAGAYQFNGNYIFANGFEPTL